jgi:Spy/CpxP family protein refolding chaperone
MDTILTPEQRQNMQAIRGEKGGMKDEWKSLNLTVDQKAKIKAIHQANQSQFKAILTPAQQSKFGNGKHHKDHSQM